MIALDTKPTLIIKQRLHLSEKEIAERNKLREIENGTLFSSYDWVKAWANSIEQWKKIIVALGYQNNKLIFVLPLVIQKLLFVSIAYSPNRKFLDQSCILSQSDLLLPFFIDQIKASIKNFILYEVSELLKEKLSHLSSHTLIEYTSTSFSVDLQRLEPYYNFSKKSFKELLRLQKKGSFQLKILPSSEVNPTHIFAFKTISSKFWTSKMVFQQIKHQKFFTEIIKIPYMKVYLLTKGNEIVALDLWGSLHGEAFSLYSAYLPKYQKYSPWNILQHKEIQEIIKDKHSFYHLYRGYTNQKKRFSNRQYKQYNLYFFSNPLLKRYFTIKLYIKTQYLVLKSSIKKQLKKIWFI